MSTDKVALISGLIADFLASPYNVALPSSARPAAVPVGRASASTSSAPGPAIECRRFEVVEVGSSSMGLATEASDLDVVAVFYGVPQAVATARGHFFASFAKFLADSGRGGAVTAASEAALVPIISFALHARQVDLAVCLVPAPVRAERLDLFDESDWFRLDRACARSVQSWRDARAVTAAVEALPPAARPHFRPLAVAVKRWARSVGVYGGSSGYLSGFSWTLLVVFFLQRQRFDDPLTARHVEALFYLFYSRWDWPSSPVSILGAKGVPSPADDARRPAVFIYGPTSPYPNTVRAITRSGLWLINRRLQEASQALLGDTTASASSSSSSSSSSDSVPPCCQVDEWPVAVRLSSQAFVRGFVVVTIGALTAAGQRQCQGWLKSRLVSLLLGLETCSDKLLALAHPDHIDGGDDNFPHAVTAVVAIGRAKGTAGKVAPVLAEFADSFQHWAAPVFAATQTGFGITRQPPTDSPSMKIVQVKDVRALARQCNVAI